VGGWCVFFHQGCVLHKVGAAEADKYAYKPAACALFPLARTADGDWYVRQWGVMKEEWDLFCLNPGACPRPASESLAAGLRVGEALGRGEGSRAEEGGGRRRQPGERAGGGKGPAPPTPGRGGGASPPSPPPRGADSPRSPALARAWRRGKKDPEGRRRTARPP